MGFKTALADCKVNKFSRALKREDMSDSVYSSQDGTTSEWMEQLFKARSPVGWNNKHTDLSPT